MICHSGKESLSGVPMPFEDEALLGQRLRAGTSGLMDRIQARVFNDGPGVMPPSGAAKEDRAELMSYLKGL